MIEDLYTPSYFKNIKKMFKMNNNYIPRKLLEKEKYYQYGEYFSFFEERSFNLYDLIVGETKRIVLLGDAGYGKSTELNAITSRLIEEKNQNFIPILIELDTYTDEEIIDYVRYKIGEESKIILNYDKSKLVFLFDEFDQVINKGIATRKIKNFMEEYGKSTFIIACRTNFYSGQFEDFNIFVLLPFNLDDIRKYTRKLLNNDSKFFLVQLKKSSLFDLSKNPFFLKSLIEIYISDHKIPEKRSEIFSKMISLSLKNDEIRLSDKYDLRQKYPTSKVENDLTYLSIIMQTLQRNFVLIEEFNKIIPNKDKREIIPELSLIKKSFFKNGDIYHYKFQHNNFQEYLAAKKLADKSLKIIFRFIYPYIERRTSLIRNFIDILEKYVDFKPYGIRVGKVISTILNLIKYKRINKINPSWLNTIAFLCQLRRGEDLPDYIMKYEPEIALKFEISRIDENKREDLFKNIFEKYTNRKILFDRDKIDYEILANFVKTKRIHGYLMKYAHSKEHFIHRYNSIQILGRMKEFADESLHKLLINYAKDENENQVVRNLCFYALAWLGIATQDTIENLKHLKDSNNDWVLSGLYYLIKESEYTDKYIDILLAGIYRYSLSSVGSVNLNLMQGIEKIQSIEGIMKIIKCFIDNPRCFQDTSIAIERPMKKIINNMITAYNLNNSIYDDVKELARTANKKYMKEEDFIYDEDLYIYKEYMEKGISRIRMFFQETGNTFNFFKEIYNEQETKGNYSLLASIANEQCVNFLINEYLEGKLTDNNIWSFINYLSLIDRKDFDFLLKIINEKTDNSFPSPLRDYKKDHKERMEREIEIIFDRGEFLKEVENIFHGEGKEELDFGDIKKIFSRIDDKKRYNNFVVHELRNYFERNKSEKWRLDRLKEKINLWDYEWFTVNHVYSLFYFGSELDLSKEQEDIIKDFCFKNLGKVNFREALKLKDKREVTSLMVIMLWFFLRKFDLKYPEGVLLDLLSFDWIEGDKFIGIDYLKNKLPFEKIKNRVLENLNREIEVDQVLKNHINYCKKYQIHEARDLLYRIVENPKMEIENRLLAIETVSKFPNSVNFIEKILDTNVHKLFSKAAKILITRNYKKYKKRLEQKLSSKDENIALESAKLLIEKQNLKAIKFYAKFVERAKKFYVDIHNRNPLQNINTIKALSILFDLLKFSYEYRNEIELNNLLYSLDSTIISILKYIALKNYSNFKKVEKQLRKFIRKYQSKYEGINFLYTVYDNIEKTFFINFYRKISVDEAINKVKSTINLNV